MVDRRLGRGLDFFLSGGRAGQAATPPTPATPAAAQPATGDVLQVEVGLVVPSPFQARKHIADSELQALSESIRASGVLQPLLVRKVGDKFELVAGERRWRAAQLAGQTKVPVVVRQVTDEESLVFGLIENLQREDLNAIEKAKGFKHVMEKVGATQEEVARRVAMDRSTVANFLRLLDLPEAIQAHVSRGTLSMGHARCLLSLSDPELMVQCADEAIRQGSSVRVLEARVKELQQASLGVASAPAAEGTKEKGASKSRPVWLNELEESLVEALGTPVSVRYGRKKSQIVIECAGREEFERVFQRLKNC